MISVEEALGIILSQTKNFGSEEISIRQSLGRILREDIRADRDMPPFDRVAMDGIAINYSAYENKIRNFPISAMSAAGAPQQTLADPTHCIEIMTGSILPLNTDTVIPYEWIALEGREAILQKGNAIKGQNVHLQGTDRKKGDLLLPTGRLISSGEIGVLASAGKSRVQVSRHPGVLVISTGNELVEVDQDPLPHQVRMSNVHQLQASLQQLSIVSDTTHLQDDYESIKTELTHLISKYEVIIISGGISEGKFDHIPAVLEELGVQKHFYKVKQKPGKPFWFGTHPGGCTVFGIPGNPVSSFLCFIRYIRPWIENCLQKEASREVFAKLSGNLTVKTALTLFVPVRLYHDDRAELMALPMKGHGSGDLSNLADADAFIELPEGRDMFLQGEVYPVYQFRS